VTPTAGGLVFAGDVGGNFHALDAIFPVVTSVGHATPVRPVVTATFCRPSTV
jgi:hypothetical protein